MKLSAINVQKISEDIINEDLLFLENILNEDLRSFAKKAIEYGSKIASGIKSKGYDLAPKVAKFINSPYGKIALALALKGIATGAVHADEILMQIGSESDYSNAVDAINYLADQDIISDDAVSNLEGGDFDVSGNEGGDFEIPSDTTIESLQTKAAADIAQSVRSLGGAGEARLAVLNDLRTIQHLVDNSNATTAEDIVNGIRENVPSFFNKYQINDSLDEYLDAIISRKLGSEVNLDYSSIINSGTISTDAAAAAATSADSGGDSGGSDNAAAASLSPLQQSYNATIESMQDSFEHADSLNRDTIVGDITRLRSHFGSVVQSITNSNASSWREFMNSDESDLLKAFNQGYFDNNRIGEQGQEAFNEFITQLVRAKWR